MTRPGAGKPQSPQLPSGQTRQALADECFGACEIDIDKVAGSARQFLQDVLLRKSKEWEYEQEHRVIRWDDKQANFDPQELALLS